MLNEWISTARSIWCSISGLPNVVWIHVLGADARNIPPWLSAISLIMISTATLRYTIKNIQATSIKNINDMYINWHKVCIDDERYSKEEGRDSIIKRIRAPVIGQTDDSIIYIFLNMLHTEYYMHRKGLMSKEQYSRALGNTMERMSHLTSTEIQEFLVHGFERGFAKEAYAEYCRLSKQATSKPSSDTC
jgi:hypothetical protein